MKINKKYQQRIIETLKFIESNLDQKLTLGIVADKSCFSEFHFHRIFSGIMNETLNDYIGRRRLETAANLLAYQTELSITEIALRTGFSSSANFAKAAKAYFGFSPSEIRNPKQSNSSKIGKLLSKYGKAFNPCDLYPLSFSLHQVENEINEETKMNVTIKYTNCQQVATLSSVGGYEPTALFSTWDKLITWAEAQGIESKQQKRFAFCHDNPAVTPVQRCRYDAAIVIPKDLEVREPFKSSTIPAGKYAVLYFKGAPEDTAKAQMGLYSHWLPESGFEPDCFPMMEHYLNDSRQDGFVEMEIHIKLKNIS